MPEELVLGDSHRAKLDGIVQSMVDNGESDDDIQFVVSDFKEKYGVKKKDQGSEKSEPSGKSSSTLPLPSEKSGTSSQSSGILGDKLVSFNKERVAQGKSAESTGVLTPEMAKVSEEKKSVEKARQDAAIKRSQSAEKDVIKTFTESAGNYLTKDLPEMVKVGASLIAQPTYTTPYGINVNLDKEYEKDPAKWEKEKQENIAKTVGDYLHSKQDEPKKEYIDQLDEIQDGLDFVNYVSSTLGKGIPQLGASVATAGGTSFLETASSVYMNGVQKKAELTGRTVKDIIESGDDNKEAAFATGVVSAGLDMLGAGKLLKGSAGNILKDKVGRSFGQKLLAGAKKAGEGAVTEGSTELAQNMVENAGSNIQAGEDVLKGITEGNLESLVQGGITGGAAKIGLTSIENGGENNEGQRVQDEVQRTGADSGGAQQGDGMAQQQEPGIQPTGTEADQSLGGHQEVTIQEPANTSPPDAILDSAMQSGDVVGAAESAMSNTNIANEFIESLNKQDGVQNDTEQTGTTGAGNDPVQDGVIDQDRAGTVDNGLQDSQEAEVGTSKWTDTFNKFNTLPKERAIEAPQYQKLHGKDLVSAVNKLVDDEGPIGIVKTLEDNYKGKKALSPTEIPKYVAAGQLLANQMEDAYSEAMLADDLDSAMQIESKRSEIVNMIALTGTAYGQVIKSLDPKWVNDNWMGFSNPQSVVKDLIQNNLLGPQLESLKEATGDKKIAEKITTSSYDIVKQVKKAIGENPEIYKEVAKLVHGIVSESKKPKKEKTTTDKLDNETIKAKAAQFREKAREALRQSRGQANDIFSALPLTMKALAYDALAVGLETYGSVRGAVNYATEQVMRAYGESFGGDKKTLSKVKKEIYGSLDDMAYEITGLEKKEPVKRPKKMPSGDSQQTVEEAIKQAVSEVDLAIKQANDAGIEASEITSKLNKYLSSKDIQAKKDIQSLLEKQFGITDQKKLSKTASEILGTHLLNPNATDVSATQVAISSMIGGGDVSASSIATAQQLAKDAQRYPEGSYQRIALTSQAMQVIANQQPVKFVNVYKTTMMANYLNGFSTFLNIATQNFVLRHSMGNKASGIPLIGRYVTQRGKLVSQITSNKLLGGFAKANLINAIMNGDVRGNALFGKTNLSGMAKDDLLRLADRHPEIAKYIRVLYAPLRAISTMDANPQTYTDMVNASRIMYEAIRRDPNNKGKSDTELTAQVKSAMKIFDNDVIEAAEKQAVKEGYEKGTPPNALKSVGKMLVGDYERKDFTKEERDWVAYQIRVQEILHEKMEEEYGTLSQGEGLMEGVTALSDRDFMKASRQKQVRRTKSDKEGNVTSEIKEQDVLDPLNALTASWWVKVNQNVDMGISSALDSDNKGIKAIGAVAAAAKIKIAPFARMMVISASRIGDYTPGYGAVKAYFYGRTIDGYVSDRDLVESQSIMHRQMVGIVTTISTLAALMAFEPEEDDKGKLVTLDIVTEQIKGSRVSKKALLDRYGRDRIVIGIKGGKSHISIPFGNSPMKPALSGLSVLSDYMRDPTKYTEGKDPDFVAQSMLLLGTTISSMTGKSYNKFFDDLVRDIKKISDAETDEERETLSKQVASDRIASFPQGAIEALIPYGNSIEQVIAGVSGERPDRKTIAGTWYTLLPYSDKVFAEPALDFFGRPIPSFPAESTNIIGSIMRGDKYDGMDAEVRDFIMENGLLPPKFPVSLDEKKSFPFSDDKIRFQALETKEVERATGKTMFEFCRTNMPSWKDLINNAPDGQSKARNRAILKEVVKKRYNIELMVHKQRIKASRKVH